MLKNLGQIQAEWDRSQAARIGSRHIVPTSPLHDHLAGLAFLPRPLRARKAQLHNALPNEKSRTRFIVSDY